MTARKKSGSDGNDITKKVVGKTKGTGKVGHKDIVIDQNSNSYFYIKFVGGGQIPKQLSGFFTRYEFAQDAVSVYLRGK